MAKPMSTLEKEGLSVVKEQEDQSMDALGLAN